MKRQSIIDRTSARLQLAVCAVLCAIGAFSPARANDAAGLRDAAPLDGGLDAMVEAGHSDAAPAAKLPDWAPSVLATVTPTKAHVGDPLRVTITLRHAQGVSVTLPLGLELGEFSELSRGQSTRSEGPDGHIPTIEQRFDLSVAAYKLGDLKIPPIEVNALGPGGELLTLHTNALPIRIVSVLANEPDPKLKGLEPPVQVFHRTWWLLYGVAGLAALGLVVLATVLIHSRVQARKRAPKPAPPPTPPHVLAYQRLDQLDVDALLAAEQYKALYLQLSEILREYLGGRWGIDALEMTTSEIAAALAQHGVLATLQQRLRSYFDDCDLVKFAKVKPDEQVARAAIVEARALVRDATPAPDRTPADRAATTVVS